MPYQSTKKGYVTFPDSALVEVDSGDGYFDVGAISGDITNTLEWEENRVESANAGPYRVQIRNQRMNGSFTLDNLDPEGVEKLGGGMFDRVSVSGAVTPEDFIMEAPQDLTSYELLLVDSGGANLRPESAPSITSVTGDSSGLITDYDVVADNSSASGYSISFEAGAVDGTEDVTVVFPSQSVISSQTIYMGSSAEILDAYKLRFTHTDDNGLIRRLELFSTDTTSGGMAFNFNDSATGGVENMVVNFSAKADSTLTTKRQLAAWTFETGAE